MGAGFIRRFRTNPGLSTLALVAGVTIIDNAPAGNIQGVQSGVVCVVGECADATYAVSVAANGDISSNPRPVQVYDGQDLVDKVGGFDSTLGDFGGALGNVFAAVEGKRFPFLVIAPVDNITPSATTNKGVRVYRDLPTNTSATDPTPVTTLLPGVVAAGREFLSSTDRVRLARTITFTSDAAIVTGVDGVAATAASAATQTFTSAGSTFVTSGVQVGDIAVVGVYGTNNAANTKTFRVQEVTSETALKLELMTGVNFAMVTETALAFRIHPAATADSAGIDDYHVVNTSASGYRCPARPLDATITAATAMSPTVVPDAVTATTWDTLSGLKAQVAPATALTYTAAVHAPNAANSSTMDARYVSAIAGTKNDSDPARKINIIVAARKSSTIRSTLKQHVADASAINLTRNAVVAPDLSVVTVAGAAAVAAANRSERVWCAWPAVQTYVQAAVDTAIDTADATTTTDGYLDDTADMWLASVLANIPPEENPGQVGDPYSTILSAIADFQRGLTVQLNMNHHIALAGYGICALRNDEEDGWVFQEGLTTSLTSGETTIARRRLADFIQDSMARFANRYSKKLAKESNKDALVAAYDTFLSGLKSTDNREAARIDDYALDTLTGNTLEAAANELYFTGVVVRPLGAMRNIVINTRIENGVAIVRAI